MITALVILSIILITFNGWCLYVIAGSTRLQSPSTFTIASLLSCHFLQGLIVIPSYMIKRLDLSNATARTAVCDTFRTSYMITNYVSCLALLLISVDRMLAIMRPLKYKTSGSNRKIFIAILIIWLYVVILCLLPFIPRGKSSSCNYLPQKEWTIAMLSCNTLLPFILILICYTLIFKTARMAREQRNALTSNSVSTSTASNAAEMKIAKISAAVVMAYAFCWGPSFVYYFLASTCKSCFAPSFKDSRTEEVLTFLMKFLTFIDGIIAPVIYCLKHAGFRHRIRLMRRRLVWPTNGNNLMNPTPNIARQQRHVPYPM